MQEIEPSWELLAKAIGRREQSLGRPLTAVEREEVRRAMARHNCDPMGTAGEQDRPA